jgi:hypothetical protein
LDQGGETRELILGANAGWAVSPDDVPAIKQVLRSVLQNAQKLVAPPVRTDFVAQFRYDRLAEKLTAVFDRVCA